MNKIFNFLLIICISLFFVSCSGIKNQSNNSGFQNASEVSFVLNEFNLNNLNAEQTQIVEDEINSNPVWLNFLNQNDVQSVSLNLNENNLSQNLGFFGDKLNWQKSISKSDILSYLKMNNISVANLSNIELEKCSSLNTTLIKFAGHNIDAKDFVKHFKFLSNRLNSINIAQNELIFTGNGFGLNPQKELIFD